MSTSISSAELKEKFDKKEKVCLIDVRRKADYEKAPGTIAGAIWHDPEEVAEWSKTLPRDQELVVYCVRGGSVSQSVADKLQEDYPGVTFLAGGIVGWSEGQQEKDGQ